MNEYSKYHLECDWSEDCLQHPIVCISCNRAKRKDCYKDKEG